MKNPEISACYRILRLPVILGITFVSIVLTGVLTNAISKQTADTSIDELGVSVSTEMSTVIQTQISSYFQMLVTTLDSSVMGIPTRLLNPENSTSMRPLLVYLARNLFVDRMQVYYSEVHKVDYTYWESTGQYRAFSYGFYPDFEWDGYQPGNLTNYFYNPTFPEVVRLGKRDTVEFTDMEPVVLQARNATGIDFQPTFVYNTTDETPDVYMGIFIPFRKNNRLDFYVNVLFSIENSDKFVALIKAQYPFHAALMESSTGELIADTNADQPSFTIIDKRVHRYTYLDSTNRFIRAGGIYVKAHMLDTPGAYDNTKNTVVRTMIDDEDSYISFTTLHIRSLRWLLFIVIPTEPIRGDMDRLNNRTVLSIIVVYVVVGAVSLFIVVWVSWSLTMLCSDMQVVSTMDLDTIRPPRSLIVYELMQIQNDFYLMISRLKEYRSYLPQHLLTKADDDESEDESDVGVTGNSKNPLDASILSDVVVSSPHHVLTLRSPTLSCSKNSTPGTSRCHTPSNEKVSNDGSTIAESKETTSLKRKHTFTLRRLLEAKKVTIVALNLRGTHALMESLTQSEFTQSLFHSMTVAMNVVTSARGKGTSLRIFGDSHIFGYGVVSKCNYQGITCCGAVLEINRTIAKDDRVTSHLLFGSGSSTGVALCGDVVAAGSRTLTAFGCVVNEAMYLQQHGVADYNAAHVVSCSVYQESSIDFAFKIRDLVWMEKCVDVTKPLMVAELLKQQLGEEADQEEWMYTLGDEGALHQYNKLLVTLSQTGPTPPLNQSVDEFCAKYSKSTNEGTMRLCSELRRILSSQAGCMKGSGASNEDVQVVSLPVPDVY